MASAGSERDAKDALSKLLQLGTVEDYQREFEMLIKRVTIPESLLKSFYISGLKVALQIKVLRARPTTLVEAFSLARLIEARFEDENNQEVDANVGDQEEPEVEDKQDVKKANDQEIKNIQDEEGKNIDQQVSEAGDDTNNDDFDCSLPPYKGVDLTVEEVVFENTTSDLKKDKDEQGKKKKKRVITFSEVGANKDNNPNGVFNDGGEVGYNKADGTWVPDLIIEDGWYLFDGLSKEQHSKSNLDVHLQFHVYRQDIGSQVKTWDPGIKSAFQDDTLRARWVSKE
ncbi:hypothetical protein Tco_1295608 [Tanacetum coccineum]